MKVRIEAVPEGRRWALTAPAFPGVAGTARSFSGIPAAALQLAVTAADLAPSGVELDLVVSAGALDVLQAQRRVVAAKAEAEAAAERAGATTREVARQLRDAGVTLADIGIVLHLSHQRVSQLLR